MLIAILNCCTKEELEEEEEEEETPEEAVTPEQEGAGPYTGKPFPLLSDLARLTADRGCWCGRRPRQGHQEQDLAGRQDVTGVCPAPVRSRPCCYQGKADDDIVNAHREETERVGELSGVNETTSLPGGALASGAEGIKESIQGFADAYVSPNMVVSAS
jgi:serine/threonine-protein phosphatase 2B catalytic subunit